jgi:hypothetical protein
MQLPETPPPPKRGFFAGLRSSFFAGLVVIAPIGVTIWLIWTLTGWIDSWVLPLIPNAYNPAILIRDLTGIEVNIRGIGVVTFLLFTVLVGWVAKGLIGRSLILWAESLVLSIPVVRSLYSGLKQIGINFASFRRFWAVAARRNSSLAPLGPRRRSRSSRRMRLRWAKSISTFFRRRLASA